MEDIDRISPNYINSLLKINGINTSENELENRLEVIFIFYKTNSLDKNDMKFVENENFLRLYKLSMEDLVQESRELKIKDVKRRKLSRGYIVKKIILEKLVLEIRFGRLPPEIIELIFSDLTVREIQDIISVSGFTLPQKYYRIIKIIKGYDIDPNLDKKETIEKIIRNAAKECNIEVVKFVVEKLNYINYQRVLDEFGIWCENEEMLLKLIEYIQIEITTGQKFNYNIIFYFSFERGYGKVVRYSLRKGADANYTINDMISNFYWRCDIEVIKFLIENKIYSDYQDIISNVRCGSKEDVYLDFIKYIENKSNKKYNYDSVLFNAASFGYLKTLKYAAGKNIKHFNLYESLVIASNKGYFSIVKYMIENIFNIKNIDLYNPLYSASDGGHLEIVKYLVEKGAKPDKRIVDSAVISNHLDMVKFLVNNGSGISNVALETAAENNNVHMFKFLFKKGDFKSKDLSESFKYTTSEEIKDFLIKNVDSPENILYDLIIFDGKENLEDVKYLVESGVDIHGGFEVEQSICMAVYYGHLEIVKYLISKGANLSGSEIKSECIKKAREEGYDEIIDYLKEVGEL